MRQSNTWLWAGLVIGVAMLAWIFRDKIQAALKGQDTGTGGGGGETPAPVNLAIRDLTGQLIVSSSRSYSSRKLSAIDTAVIHHSATTSGSAQSYARYHVETNNWPGIGYHYVIDTDGTINQVNALTTVSFHVKNNNTRSVGICLTGNYETQQPPAVQIESAILLIRYLNGLLGRKLRIKGHGELQAKACPGKNVNVRYIEKTV